MRKIYGSLCLLLLAVGLRAQTVQTHHLSFQNNNGVFGGLVIKTKPTTVGYAYLWIQQESVRIDGIELNGSRYTGNQLVGFSFPILCEDCYFKVNGVACINFNGPPHECGEFSSTDVMRGALGKSSPEVMFSQATKDKHNLIRRSEGVNTWELSGFVQSVEVEEVKGSAINEILRKAKRNN